MAFQFCNREWLAGFFDGEGSVTVTYDKYVRKNGSRTFRLIVQITQNDKDVLARIAAQHGGAVRAKGVRCHVLRMESIQAERFLKFLLPSLVLKRHVALLALRYRTLSGNQYRRHTGKGRPFLKYIQQQHEHLRSRIMQLNGAA